MYILGYNPDELSLTPSLRPDDSEEDVEAYIVMLQERRGFGYDTLSAAGNGKSDHQEQPKLWTLHCQRCLGSCMLGDSIRKGWSLSSHLRVFEEQGDGHMGTGVVPYRSR